MSHAAPDGWVADFHEEAYYRPLIEDFSALECQITSFLGILPQYQASFLDISDPIDRFSFHRITHNS